MRVAIIDCGSKKVPNIAAAVSEFGAEGVIVPLVDANSFDFESPAAVIISGGGQKITDQRQRDLLNTQTEFLTSLQTPVLGICLGHQILALRAGGEPFLGTDRKGRELIKFTEKHQLLNGIPEVAEFEENHTEGVTLPHGFRLLGSSDHYEVEMITANEKPFFGVQFHPEVSEEVGRTLINNFLEYARAHNNSREKQAEPRTTVGD